MSDNESQTEDLSRDSQEQELTVGGGLEVERRDSQISDTSHSSSVAGTRKRTKGVVTLRPEGSSRKVKGRHPKVRTGCDTCKQRKIKCDEGKPECMRCVKSGRQCQGYNPPRMKLFVPSRTSLSLDAAHVEELEQYFKKEVAVILAFYRPLHLQLEFWQIIIPRFAVECPPIRHAMLALAATVNKFEARYSKPDMTEISKTDPYFALEQYTEGVSHLGSGLSAANVSVNATLICCLLLTLCDLWSFGQPLLFNHVFFGLELCRVVRKTSPSKSPLPETTDIDGAMMIPAYQYFADFAMLAVEELNEEQSLLLQDFAEGIDPVLPTVFPDAREGYAVMDRLLRKVAKLDPGRSDAFVAQINDELSSLSFTLQDSLSASQSGEEEADYRMLLVHHKAASILLNALLTGSEYAYDDSGDGFDFIISEIEKLLTFQGRVWSGIIPPLFLTATKCRIDSLRLRALQAMHQVQQFERLWSSCTAHQIAQEIVRLENTNDNEKDELQPESGPKRINLKSVQFHSADSVIVMDYQVIDRDQIEVTSSTMEWEMDLDEDMLDHKPDNFKMPDRILRVCGYSALGLAYRKGDCHCGIKAPQSRQG